MGMVYTKRHNTIHWTRGYKVFECVTKYMGVISQNALSLITAPPSGGNSGRKKIIKFFARWDLYSKFGEFWGMFRQWKMQSFCPKKKNKEKK